MIEIRGHHLLVFFYCFSVAGEEREERILWQTHVESGRRDYGIRSYEEQGCILREISNNPQIRIRLVTAIDSFCKDCLLMKKSCMDERGSKYDKKFIRDFSCKVNAIYSLEELIKRGNNLIEVYKKALPLKRGRPRRSVVVGSILNALLNGQRLDRNPMLMN